MDNASNNDTLIEELEARKLSIEIILIFLRIFIGRLFLMTLALNIVQLIIGI